MKPVALFLLALSASALHADTAQELFNRAVYSTCPSAQVELYTEALQKDPGLDMGHHNLGAAYYRLGRFDRAIRVLEMALIAEPTYPNTHYLLSCCYSRLGDTDRALSHLRKAIRYGWNEADMVANDTDFDGIRGSGFPRVHARSGRGGHGKRSGSRTSGKRSRKRSKAANAAAAAPVAGAPAAGGPPDAGVAAPPVAGPPDAPPQAGK